MTSYTIVGNITILDYLTVSAIVFVIAICGILSNKRSMISVLMSIELMLLAVNLNFTAFSAYLQDIHGQIFTIFILTVAATEAAIGLAIIMKFFRGKANTLVDSANEMRG